MQYLARRNQGTRMFKQIARSLLWVFIWLSGAVVILFLVLFISSISVPVKLPSIHVYTGSWDAFASAAGTWVIENDKSAHPMQTTEIFCRRSEMQCAASQAEVTDSGHLFLSTYKYNVTKWDENIIKYINTDAVCVDYSYTIERESKRVFGTRKTKSAADGCSIASPGPLNLILMDGFKVSNELSQEAVQKVSPFGWLGLGLWSAFISFRLWHVWRRQTPRMIEA